jgi:aryl-alcohol dehydrogenase-like predicted oxidoreductase
LGRTAQQVTLFSLGGEGILRTHGQMPDAVAVIERALDRGVNYCDTAPAYASSMDYYGAALGGRRGQVFLASKTADRTRDGSLRILDDSLKRLRTDHLDLWQLHDLRTMSEVDTIFSKRGAIHALTEARQQGRVRFLGLTGHYDPAVLIAAMGRFDFDTVLVALNAADVHRLSFANTVLPEAAGRGMGVIGMKVYAAGALVGPGGLCTPEDAMHYVLSLAGVSTVIIGCCSAAEVDANVRAACAFRAMPERSTTALQERVRARATEFTSYKRGVTESAAFSGGSMPKNAS